MAISLCRDVSARTIIQNALTYIKPDSRVDTDTWNGYNWLDHCYEHRTVKHSERYVTEDGTHSLSCDSTG